MQPTLSKGSANREQCKINSFIFIAEMKPTLSKGSAKKLIKREKWEFIHISEREVFI